MRFVYIMILTVVLLNSLVHADENPSNLTIAADQSNGMITVMTADSRLLYFSYYDWGPEWSGVYRNIEISNTSDKVEFKYKNTIERTQANFVIEGSWSKKNDKEIIFTATLTPEKNSEITQAQFTLSVGELLRSNHGKALIYNSKGLVKESTLPFHNGLIGEDITEIELYNYDNQLAKIYFDSPTYISAERNNARIAIARDYIHAEQPIKLGFTIKFHQSYEFYPGPDSIANTQDGWYSFDHNAQIQYDSILSLASWLDVPAGRDGRIYSENNQLKVNGRPIKLWGLNLSYSACAPNKEIADRRAHFYAAMGINSVRCHKYADGPGWRGITSNESSISFDPEKLDRFDYFIATLKNHGIYTKLSPVFIIKPGPEDIETIPYINEFQRNSDGWYDPKHGSLYFSPEIQDLLIKQFSNLLTHVNPYTGLSYAEDPTIAYIEIYNEDSIFFYGTASALARSTTLRMNAGKLFSQWLKEKYQNESAWRRAWGSHAINSSILINLNIPTNESWSSDRIYPIGNPWFYDPNNLESTQSPYRQRLYDTMEFLYQHQNSVYSKLKTAIRNTGYTGEVISSNWIAGRQMSHLYNLHSDALIGTIDRHNYFGGGSRPYHTNSSMIDIPGSGILSSGLHQVANRPFMLSEWIHESPNEWAVEGVAIIGAYGMGLQGWDASYAFQNSDDGRFSSSLRDRWDVTAPNFIGLFPAVSRQVHRHDIQESLITHDFNVNISSLQTGNVSFEIDEITNGDIKTYESDVFPAKALAAVKTQIVFTGEDLNTPVLDLKSYEENNTILSSTEELSWTTGETNKSGYITINTDGTQAVIGFAKNIPIHLQDSSIEIMSDFGAVYLTALSRYGKISNDDILITAISRSRNTGAIVMNDRYIMSDGYRTGYRPDGPVLMEPVHFKITTNLSNYTVYALDHSGNLTEEIIPITSTNTIIIDTKTYRTPYYYISRKQ